jgi:hypothetical protein
MPIPIGSRSMPPARSGRHWAMPEWWVTCALGPYNFEFMTEVTQGNRHAVPVDGVFSNRWAGSGMCYCEHCRENFKNATGLDLPRTLDPADAARRAYIEWRQQRLFELWRLWDTDPRDQPRPPVISPTPAAAR